MPCRATAELQAGRPGYRALWRHFCSVTRVGLERECASLGVRFDLWKGESDVDPLIEPMVADLRAKGLLEEDQGALIVRVARPGARRDVLESYVKRVKTMEEIARSFKGVDAAYAIQAGRELRIITKSDVVSDLDTYQLAKDIAKRIESEMQYPGHIRVTVIREHRAIEYAR